MYPRRHPHSPVPHHRSTDLVPPVSLDKIRRPRRNPSNESLRAIVSRRSPKANRFLSLHPQLDMDNPEHEKRSHRIIEIFAISTIQLHDAGECEGKWHILEEILVRSGIEEKSIGVVVGGRLSAVFVAVAHEFLIFQAAVNDAIGEVNKVGGEGEGPGAGDG